jgi:hypothetical protein
LVCADYHTENAATYATNAINARIAESADRCTDFDVMGLAELVELVDEALLGRDGRDEESPWSAGVLVSVTVGLGFLDTVAPPWMGSLEIYWV